MKPHKHAELIKAWADGAEIEFYTEGKWIKTETPKWDWGLTYRIKPKVKWTPEYTLSAYEYKKAHPKPAAVGNNLSDDVKNYWKLTKFVEEFETDWDNQNYEIFRGVDRNYNMDGCGVSYPSLGAVRMSKQCAEKLCKMLNSGEVEL